MTAAPDRPLDLLALLGTLARHDVDYLVIGGVAVQVHGHRRTTRDLDIIPSPHADNHRRLAAALEELGVRADPDQLRVAPIAPPFLTDQGELHVLNSVKGAAPYDEMRKRALVLEIAGIQVALAGLDDLIAMKRAAGRPADLADLAVLTATRVGPA